MKILQLKLKIIAVKTAILELLFELFKIERKKKSSPKETIEELIRRIAKEYNVDPDLAVKVAQCESNFNPTAVNINSNASIDRGLFQWNDEWHPEISVDCAYEPECATIAFCIAVKEGNLCWWNASKHCWSK